MYNVWKEHSLCSCVCLYLYSCTSLCQVHLVCNKSKRNVKLVCLVLFKNFLHFFKVVYLQRKYLHVRHSVYLIGVLHCRENFDYLMTVCIMIEGNPRPYNCGPSHIGVERNLALASVFRTLTLFYGFTTILKNVSFSSSTLTHGLLSIEGCV